VKMSTFPAARAFAQEPMTQEVDTPIDAKAETKHVVQGSLLRFLECGCIVLPVTVLVLSSTSCLSPRQPFAAAEARAIDTTASPRAEKPLVGNAVPYANLCNQLLNKLPLAGPVQRVGFREERAGDALAAVAGPARLPSPRTLPMLRA
jgi:hypothetical protein